MVHHTPAFSKIIFTIEVKKWALIFFYSHRADDVARGDGAVLDDSQGGEVVEEGQRGRRRVRRSPMSVEQLERLDGRHPAAGHHRGHTYSAVNLWNLLSRLKFGSCIIFFTILRSHKTSTIFTTGFG